MRRTLLFVLPALVALGPGCSCDGGGVSKVTGTIALDVGVVDIGAVCLGDSTTYALGVSNSAPVPLNISSVTVQGDGASAFTVQSFPEVVASGSSDEIVLAFAPTAAGDVFADLVVESDDQDHPSVTVRLNGAGDDGVRVDAQLLCEGEDGTTLAPCKAPLSFGSVALGSFLERPIVLSNAGCAVLTVSSVEITADGNQGDAFELGGESAPFKVSRAGGRTIAPKFSPLDSDSYVATLSVTWADENVGGEPFTTDTMLVGYGVEPHVVITPASFSFKDADVSTPQTQAFTAQNIGGLDTEITSLTFQSGNPDFTAVPSAELPVTLPSQGTFDFDVTYAPTEAGRDAEVLLVGTSEGTVEVKLTGGAVPNLTLDPAATVDFGSVETGGSAEAQVTIGNTGQAALTVNDLTFSLNPSDVFSIVAAPPLPVVVQPNDSFQITLGFDDNPRIGTDGAGGGQSEVGELAVVTDDPAYDLQGHTRTLNLETDTVKNLGPTAVIRTYIAGTECVTYPCSMLTTETASFDASSSTDPESDPLGYSWRLVSAPQGGTATLTGLSGAAAELSPDFPGEWNVELTVTDLFGNTSTEVVKLLVSQP